MSETDERLQKALCDVAAVQFIDNTVTEAATARQEVECIVRALCAEAADLREQLAASEALVPEPAWLELIARANGVIAPDYCTDCPFWDSDMGCCEARCDTVRDWARELAARVRKWQKGENDDDED